MSRWNAVLVSLAASTLIVAVSCGNDDDMDVDPTTTTTEPPTTTSEIDRGAGELPNEVLDPDRAPVAELFLPQLGAYRTDDDVDAGEMRASLDGGGVSYEEVRRRLVVDDQGFTRAEVTVVTFTPESEPGQLVSHWYGAAARTPVDVGGVDMERVATDPFDAVVWLGPRFAVAFERGQEMTAGARRSDRRSDACRLTIARGDRGTRCGAWRSTGSPHRREVVGGPPGVGAYRAISS